MKSLLKSRNHNWNHVISKSRMLCWVPFLECQLTWVHATFQWYSQVSAIALSPCGSVWLYMAVDNWSLYCFICDAIFFTCMHAHIALSNKTKSLLKNCWIRNNYGWCAWRRQGELALPIHIDSVHEQIPGTVIRQPMLHTSTKEASGDKTSCYSVIDGKLQLKHARAANKKWHKKHWKCNKVLGYQDQQKAGKQCRKDSNSSVYRPTL